MSQRIRVTAKRRRDIDVDKLAFALLRILEAQQAQEETSVRGPRSASGGAKAPTGEESVA